MPLSTLIKMLFIVFIIYQLLSYFSCFVSQAKRFSDYCFHSLVVIVRSKFDEMHIIRRRSASDNVHFVKFGS